MICKHCKSNKGTLLYGVALSLLLLTAHRSLWEKPKSYYFRNKKFTFFEVNIYRFAYNHLARIEILILLNRGFCKNHWHIPH